MLYIEVSRSATFTITRVCHWDSYYGVWYHVCADTWYRSRGNALW